MSSKSRASRAWPRQLKLALGSLTTTPIASLEKTTAIYATNWVRSTWEMSSECLWQAGNEKVFPVPVLLISGPLETIGGGVPNQSAQREGSRGAFWKGWKSASSFSLPSSGPRGSESLERPVVKLVLLLFPGWPSPYGQTWGWPQRWWSGRLECLPGYQQKGNQPTHKKVLQKRNIIERVPLVQPLQERGKKPLDCS